LNASHTNQFIIEENRKIFIGIQPLSFPKGDWMILP